ncbi:hypothetical protein NicSoilB4_05420 [Arthrobacter sp. NicSoilB4]|nr:hypothetical protein NicSoilB4_05420 [Arthrobacter sp. NicSoilB4]
MLMIAYWQWTLAGIALWIFFRIMWRHVSKAAAPHPKPKQQRALKPEPVRTKPVREGVLQSPPRPKPVPARELPAQDYLPRWTTTRRFYTNREHDDWQRLFDNVA